MHFLSDLFEKLYSLILTLQGPSEDTIATTSKLCDEKLILWKIKFSRETFDGFPTVDESP